MPWKKIIHILDKTTIYFSKNTNFLFRLGIILYILSKKNQIKGHLKSSKLRFQMTLMVFVWL